MKLLLRQNNRIVGRGCSSLVFVFLRDELYLLKQLYFTGCDKKVSSLKAMVAKNYMISPAQDPHRCMMYLYDSICRNENQLLGEVSNLLKKPFDGDLTALQRSVCSANYSAEKGVQ